MSLKPSSIVGGPLDNSVLNQLAVRKKVVTKRAERSTDDILALNGSTGWVKMTSSVDTLSTGTVTAGEEAKGNSALAKVNILLGGTAKISGMQGGIFNGKDSAYDKSALLGYRPMAGITGFQVESKNTFGTLRVASVNFQVNTIEQLDEVEQLFLRPGFTVLLEWGHSLYLNNEGNLQTTIQTYPNTFFSKTTKANIYTGVENLKRSSFNNYDAMYGVIKNFVWSFNLDGGYDCKVDIVSIGEIIESLKLIISPSTLNLKGSKYYNENQNTTSLHGFLNLVKNSNTESLFEKSTEERDAQSAFSNITGDLMTYAPGMYNELSTALGLVGREFHVMRAQLAGKSAEKYGEWSRYITVGSLLQLINQCFTLKTEFDSLISFYIGKAGEQGKTPFLTFETHFALDPHIAVLPKAARPDLPSGKQAQGLKSIHYKISEQALAGYDTDDILNIYINVDYILECADLTIKGESANQDSVFDFITKILTGVQETMGDINDFQLHYEENEGMYYVVDKKLTPDEDALKNSYIDLVGLKSTLENLTFASKLSSNITAMMAISAQAGTSNTGQDLLAMQTWQHGLQDRHNPTKSIGSQPLSTEAEIPQEDLVRLGDFMKELNSGSKFYLKYDAEDVEGLVPTHRLLISRLLEYYTKKEKKNPAGLIPFELSFTIQGIGGMKIGQAFRIDDSIIPKRYRGQVAFLITGVSHTMNSNRWQTMIKTQMIISKKFGEGTAVKDLNTQIEEDYEIETLVTVLGDPQVRQNITSYKTGPLGVSLIKQKEGLRLTAYKDPASGNKPVTIGYGTTNIDGKPVPPKKVITPAQAEQYLRADLVKFEKAVKRKVRVKLTQNEFDALVSFTYNLGEGNLEISNLLRKVNSKDYEQAARQFTPWNKAGGKVVAGLTARRKQEAQLFLLGSPGNKG